MQTAEGDGVDTTETLPPGTGQPSRLAGFSWLMLQLALVAIVVYWFRIESTRYFFPVLCVLISGFAIHAWLPVQYRLGFFALLSAACVPFVLGLDNGFGVLFIGGVLIGICYFSRGLMMRGLLLAAAAAGLIVLRERWPSPLWPILGSMFMFRLIVYVYETRRQALRPSWAESASYFFMAPNPCFPLFPVVDFNTFRNSRFNGDEWAIAQRGVTWIVRGIGHLLLYRYIKANLVPAPYELYSIPHIALFMATNYALYLRVSGQFHLITGVLHLFGFNLPRTHDNYFLASSFTDIWRRINIYWKDFMMKVFFFPSYYALHGRGVTRSAATVAAVICVFLATWLLHSWQTFWLRGRFPLTWNDAVLWIGVGICVAVNALLDARRRSGAERPLWWGALSLSARIVGMFSLVSVFWACWTNPHFPTVVIGALQRPGSWDGLGTVGLYLGAAILVGGGLIMLHRSRFAPELSWPALSFHETAALHAAGLGLVVVCSSSWFGQLLNERVAQAIVDFRKDAQTVDEAMHQMHGYYEDLNLASIQAGPLIEALSPHDESRRAQAAGFDRIARRVGSAQSVELIPGASAELSGALATINRFGMRDRDSLTLNKPTDATRIAMVGSSIVMGFGVADDETFSRLLENELNSRTSDRRTRYEVLNFGVGRQWATHRLLRIERQVLGFDPDALYYFAHQDEFQSLASHIAGLDTGQLKFPYPPVQAAVDRLGITPDMPPGRIAAELNQAEDELLGAIYQTIVDDCRSRGILPVWIYLPIPTPQGADIADRLLPIASSAGFITIDLSFWIEDREATDVLPAAGEHHPHAQGHQLIAEALMQALKAHPEALPGPLGR